MRLTELMPALRCEFILHRFDAQVIERPDCLVVQTPSNPLFYWGNFLMLPHTPADADLPHWLARFEAEVASAVPGVRHVSIGFNSAPPPPVALPGWRAAGFERQDAVVLRLQRGELQTPAPPRGEVQVRPIDWSQELDATLALQCSDSQGHEPGGWRAFRQAQMQRYAAMQQAGLAEWFGAWCDGVLAADCGLLKDGRDGRFQTVFTHPAWRRRGLCRTLVHGVSQWAFEQAGLDTLWMMADPGDVAIHIYRSLGYADQAGTWGLMRRPAGDHD